MGVYAADRGAEWRHTVSADSAGVETTELLAEAGRVQSALQAIPTVTKKSMQSMRNMPAWLTTDRALNNRNISIWYRDEARNPGALITEP